MGPLGFAQGQINERFDKKTWEFPVGPQFVWEIWVELPMSVKNGFGHPFGGKGVELFRLASPVNQTERVPKNPPIWFHLAPAF